MLPDDSYKDTDDSFELLTIGNDFEFRMTVADNDFNTEKKTLFATYIWNGARILSDYLIDQPHLVRDKSVVELGAGAGLPTLVCLKLQAKYVLATDYLSTSVLDNLKQNIERNIGTCSSRCSVLSHCWGEDVTPLLASNDKKQFEIALIAECLWRHESHQVLLQSLYDLLIIGGVVYVTYSHHIPGLENDDDFFFEYAKKQFIVEHVTTFVAKKMWNDNNTDIYLFKLIKRDIEQELNQVITSLLPKYFRIINSYNREIKICISKDQQSVKWMHNFLAVPIVSISPFDSSSVLKDHGCYPMDISSAIAVRALFYGDTACNKVLDLCCCPGSKSALIYDIMSNSNSTDITKKLLVGVDISLPRLLVCKSLLRKIHKTCNDGNELCRSSCSTRHLVLLADGMNFNLKAMETKSDFLLYDSSVQANNKLCKNKGSKNRELRELRLVEESILKFGHNVGAAEDASDDYHLVQSNIFQDYDAVLVDAECTHDGSYRHMKFAYNGTNSQSNNTPLLSKKNCSVDRIFDEINLQRISDLQKGLICSAFMLLKPGGCLVYSTCSLQVTQNEEIVEHLLATYSNASLVHLSIDNLIDANTNSSRGKDDHSEVSSLLKLPSKEEFLFEYYRLFPSKEDRARASTDVCSAVCDRFLNEGENSRMPGTLRLTISNGVSGLFIVKVKKSL